MICEHNVELKEDCVECLKLQGKELAAEVKRLKQECLALEQLAGDPYKSSVMPEVSALRAELERLKRRHECRDCEAKAALCQQLAEVKKHLRDVNRGAETNARALRYSVEENMKLELKTLQLTDEVERLTKRGVVLVNVLLEAGVIVNDGDEWICKLCDASAGTRENIRHEKWCAFMEESGK